MTRTLVDQIAAAVLYEGYILYPYRPAAKNRQRWTFGGLYPRAWAEANGDSCMMRTECLVAGDGVTAITASVRFLHLLARTVGKLSIGVRSPTMMSFSDFPRRGSDSDGAEPEYRPVESLQVGDRIYQTWQEATERQVAIGETTVGDLLHHPRRHEFTFPASRALEPLDDSEGTAVGVLDRRQQAILGAVELKAEQAGEAIFKITVEIINQTMADASEYRDRDAALLRAMVSTHAVLGVRRGEFISLTDPPEKWRLAAAGCQNAGCWPVLVGAEGDCDAMLASPIILPDYPQIAPESPGDLFDGGEIDEILTLRILTLTDDEKRLAMAVDDRAKAMLERTEALANDRLMQLHGTMRGAGEAAHD